MLMWQDSYGDEAGGGSLEEMLFRKASELDISEGDEFETDSDDEATEENHANPFESKGIDEEDEE